LSVLPIAWSAVDACRHDGFVAPLPRPGEHGLSDLDTSADDLMRVASTDAWGIGHVDVWAHPRDLLAAVADVVVERKRP
jgi:hypothetical protein